MGICASTSEANFLKLYELDESHVLGEGSFAVVYKGRNKRTGDAVAIKRIDKSCGNEEVRGKYWQDEVAMMQQCAPHANIVELLHLYESPTHVFIVTELAQGGELFQALISEGAYSEWDTKRFIRDLLEALHHIHDQQVVHRDIKPENLLLTARDPKEARIKLGDFGSAMPVNGTSHFSCQQLTWAYCAPEILRERLDLQQQELARRESAPVEPASSSTQTPTSTVKAKTANPSATPKSDVWSVGIVLYVLLSGVHPFDPNGRHTRDQIIHSILIGEYSLTEPPLWESDISKEAKSLLSLLLMTDPNERPTAKDALAHPWFRDPTTPRVALQVSTSNGLGQYQLLMQKKFRTSVIVAMAAQSLRRSLHKIRLSKTVVSGATSRTSSISTRDIRLETTSQGLSELEPQRQSSANAKLFKLSSSSRLPPLPHGHEGDGDGDGDCTKSEQQSMELIDEFDGDQPASIRPATLPVEQTTT